jgi:hypothetical protein
LQLNPADCHEQGYHTCEANYRTASLLVGKKLRLSYLKKNKTLGVSGRDFDFEDLREVRI